MGVFVSRQAGGPRSRCREYTPARRAFRPRLGPSRVGRGRGAPGLSHRSLYAIRGCFPLPMRRPFGVVAHDPITAVGMVVLGPNSTTMAGYPQKECRRWEPGNPLSHATCMIFGWNSQFFRLVPRFPLLHRGCAWRPGRETGGRCPAENYQLALARPPTCPGGRCLRRPLKKVGTWEPGPGMACAGLFLAIFGFLPVPRFPPGDELEGVLVPERLTPRNGMRCPCPRGASSGPPRLPSPRPGGMLAWRPPRQSTHDAPGRQQVAQGVPGGSREPSRLLVPAEVTGWRRSGSRHACVRPRTSESLPAGAGHGCGRGSEDRSTGCHPIQILRRRGGRMLRR
jgi:hypothetical protein